MAPGSHSLESGAGWVPPSLSSTHILTFGSELSLAGGASCSDRKQLRRSTPCPEPQLSSCSSTTTCAPSAFRSVTLVAFVCRRWLNNKNNNNDVYFLRTNNIRYCKTSNPVLIIIWLWKVSAQNDAKDPMNLSRWFRFLLILFNYLTPFRFGNSPSPHEWPDGLNLFFCFFVCLGLSWPLFPLNHHLF